MNFKEDRCTELKETISNTFLKSVSAFANFITGSIYFGVKDNGDVLGIENIQKARMAIENKINDSIKPIPKYEMR